MYQFYLETKQNKTDYRTHQFLCCRKPLGRLEQLHEGRRSPGNNLRIRQHPRIHVSASTRQQHVHAWSPGKK